MYNQIFYTNVLRRLDEDGLTKQDLAVRSGVSTSLLSDLTHGKGNPSLETMVKIAQALGTPLTVLLESNDLEPEDLRELMGEHPTSSLPAGLQRVSAVLPDFQAFQVKQWAAAARKRLKG